MPPPLKVSLKSAKNLKKFANFFKIVKNLRIFGEKFKENEFFGVEFYKTKLRAKKQGAKFA